MARPSQKPDKEKTNLLDDAVTTPLMRQYNQFKQKHPDAILFFRIGDFYETFGTDAVTTSKVLGITLTSRNNGGNDVELAGFPHHSLNYYLPKMVRAGYRVAICEQLEKPVTGKIVRRGVTEIITPGIASDDNILDQKKNNYLASVYIKADSRWLLADSQEKLTAFSQKLSAPIGIAFLDISTGEFLVSEGDWATADKMFQAFQPAEIIFSKAIAKEINERWNGKFYLYPIDDWVFQPEYGREKLLAHFETKTLKGFGIEDMMPAQTAAGAALHYLATTEKTNLKHITHIARLQHDKYVWLDRFTVRNLELINTQHDTGKSLIDVLDKTLSPMGARLMKKWVLLPLKTKTAIEARHDTVQFLMDNPIHEQEIYGLLKSVGDLERLISKVPLGKINPREMRQLARALRTVPALQKILVGSSSFLADRNEQPTANSQQLTALRRMSETLNPCLSICEDIEKSIVDNPPVHISKGGSIADGADDNLDELRHIVRNAQDLLLDIQKKEIARTGINSLKIGFNNVFGYFLEVTAKFKHAEVPKDWIRKQTLANAERYITPELKVLEEKILSAEEKILSLEEIIFNRLMQSLMDFIEPIQTNANTIAVLDCLRAFAELARKNDYTRPILNDDFTIDIKAGRHPVIEQQLPVGEMYVPNDIYLDRDSQQILMITGPNMAGKSAVLRQTGLISLMAQMGSFVPAKSATLGILDKLFTRVGASDNISSGESTFMVEMNETASIMNNITPQSLILLDEIGRGTSTYDGISIAWSIAEFLHDSAERPRTLFATHYHELNELAQTHERVKNYHVATKELAQKIIFLRKLVEGGSEHSFGVHVAKMAGMPKEIIQRANEILVQLEQQHIEVNDTDSAPQKAVQSKHVSKQTLQKAMERPVQLSFFDISDPRLQLIKDALDAMDLNAITPVELMMKVYEWKKMLKD